MKPYCVLYYKKRNCTANAWVLSKLDWWLYESWFVMLLPWEMPWLCSPTVYLGRPLIFHLVSSDVLPPSTITLASPRGLWHGGESCKSLWLGCIEVLGTINTHQLPCMIFQSGEPFLHFGLLAILSVCLPCFVAAGKLWRRAWRNEEHEQARIRRPLEKVKLLWFVLYTGIHLCV